MMQGLIISVQIGPEELGAPLCSYRMASPRCPSYNLAEPNVHRGTFLLQNGSPSWPLVTSSVAFSNKIPTRMFNLCKTASIS